MYAVCEERRGAARGAVALRVLRHALLLEPEALHLQHLVLLMLRGAEDDHVDGDHNDRRRPERDSRADHRVHPVHGELAELRAQLARYEPLGRRVDLRVDRDLRDEERHDPREHQHHRGHVVCHEALVVQRLDDRQVAVHADVAQVDDRRRREEHVVRVEDVADKRVLEHPFALTELENRIEGHHRQTCRHKHTCVRCS